MENIEKNIKAIEEEKKEYLASKDVHQGGASSSSSPSVKEDINTEGKEHSKDSEEIEDAEVEVTEISLNDIEIQEWIAKLQLLKESKEPINLEIDNETELLINYEDNNLEEEEM